ncbi:hypothetical protein P7228_03435 [Altererythrobacter arenosus]|uniref:Cytochrome oxidase subunit I profile domain-containing protein n=1 Tax=Altererythrobacter arenosus TaxID=3032592 RepID=A0ABY8FSZ6_9SPHN|nr:hypothetical protein [Altererythrobacter sp. CAU 1644]WFL78134.1 hypothetical protein P7228_03435 [Altererythrobacter sp. CAU 1644]
MATHAESNASHVHAPVEGTLTAFIDRWIYVFMAVFLIAIVLVGFIPDSLMKMDAVAQGQRPPFPMVMHVHAVLMGSWMLLLLAQTTLMATGRRGMHMQLGILGMILAPALVLAGVVLVPVNLRLVVAFSEGAPPAAIEQTQQFLHFMTNIAIAQFRIGVCFLLMVFIALRARRNDSELHKRMIILATIAPLPAAFDRMTFLPHTLPDSPLTMDFWPLLAILPMLVWDIYRGRGVHKAYLIYAAIMVPSAIIVNLLWNSAWWHSVMPGILYGA